MTAIRLILLSATLAFAGCAGKKPPKPATGSGQAQIIIEQPTTKGSGLSESKRMIVNLAKREWEFFGRQTVLFEGEEESIPHVGKWEDDGDPYTSRVNWYWRAVGKPGLDGNDCKQPWSAAFISWVMQEAGVPEWQFPAADAHRDYLVRIMNTADYSGAGFVPHGIHEYQPVPGDLICATRGRHSGVVEGTSPRLVLMDHAKLHCDIVVERNGDMISTIGGNVRNSVSKTMLKLDAGGHVQPTQRRPWFMALENRL